MPDLSYPGDGGVVHGHLAVPGGPGTTPPPERWPGVVVIHEAFGQGIEGAVDRYVAMTRATQQLVILTSS